MCDQGGDETGAAIGAARIAIGIAANERDLPVAGCDEMVHHLAHGMGIGKADHMADGLFRQIPGFDYGDTRV